MKIFSIACILLLLAAVLPIAAAFADNITVYDGDGYMTSGRGGEDGETEPGCLLSQAWDLEAVIFEANKLTMIGGWDFLDGAPNSTIASGDVFLSFDGAPLRTGPGVNGNWNFEWVFDMNWPSVGGNSPSTALVGYVARDISGGAVLSRSSEPINRPESDPFRYVSGGQILYRGNALFQTYANNAAVNAAFADDLSGLDALTGGRHYSLTFDFVPYGGMDLWTHTTMGCGNDNLIGHKQFPVPEPATMVLMGMGFAGMIAARKRFRA